MKRYLKNHATSGCRLASLLLVSCLALPLPSQAASVTLATSPLATSTTTEVRPNVLFVLDDSGSMTWTYLPDTANAFRTKYGYHSSQCNAIYYNPSTKYLPPLDASKNVYADASFTAARDNGFDSSSTTRNLNSEFIANRFDPPGANTTYSSYGSYSGTDSLGPYGAFYYVYSGSQAVKKYTDTSSTFYTECNTSISSASAVFSKRRLATTETTTITVGAGTATTVSSIKVNGVEIMSGTSTGGTTTTSTIATNIAAKISLNGYSATASGSTITITGPTSAANYTPVITVAAGSMPLTTDVFPDTAAENLTNFANWYSFYRTRLLTMKTAAGRSFSTLDNRYRIGLMKINSSSSPTQPVGLFESTQRTDWYSSLYDASYSSGGTPLRKALAAAGRYYGGKLSGTDPIQYSCQQNFTILSTDGYWNENSGYVQLDGSTNVGQQDGTAVRPMNDGAHATSTWTFTYTRDSYSKVTSGCGSGKKKLQTQPQIGTCTKSVGTGSCTPSSWISNGPATISGSCTNTAAPAASAPVQQGSAVESTGTSGGTSNTLADVAMYYYENDLRTSNCTGALGAGEDVCKNNVFISGSDNNVRQHMTTFTLGLGVNGRMNYSSSYMSDSTGDFVAVKLGSTAKITPSTITVSGTDSTSVSSIQVNGVELMTGASTASTSSNTVAANIAAKISLNGFAATASGSTVTISAPAWATNLTPVITQSGTMTLTATATPVCTWQAADTTCNWPVPSDDAVENIDDLWHAAVNGRGAYFSATDPTSLSAGLSNALAGINARKGSAAAAATSTLNPVAGNNFAYVASYTTVAWKGNLEARSINTDTGVVSENATWCVENVAAGTCAPPGSIVAETVGDTTISNCVTPDSVTCTNGVLDGTNCKVQVATTCTGTMNSLVTDSSDTRMIKTPNSAGTALIDFNAAYATANPTNFAAAHISSLSQWSSLSAAQKTAAEGTNLINYLRGQYGHEDRTTNAVDNRLYRYREAVLGDALESQPAFIGKPMFSYPYPGYSTFATAQAARAGTVFMGANDGMMHAFATDTGSERWAYVPSMVIPEMWRLADTNYATLHRNFVNGSPTTSDICTANCTCDDACVTAGNAAPVWKTILVAGLNGGGRGYYALDITTPSTPALLWELTPTTGSGSVKNDDVGYGFGQPIITRKSDGTWVVLVTSGYNNSSPGDGKGYLYVVNASTGTIISKIATTVGDTTTPSGLAKIAAWNDEPAGNQTTYVYGGDLLGNVWRFNINSTATAAIGTGEATKFATLFSDTAGTSPQPIMTTPVLGKIAGKRVVFVGTGKYLETGDLTTTQTQTQYAIKDDDATATLVNPRTTLVRQTLTDNPDGTASRLVSSNAVNFYSGRGWYFDFPDSGERTNIDTKLVQGTLLIPSIVPTNSACSPGGYGWLNFVDYKTGGAIDPANPLASLKYDATIVGINVIYIDGQPKISVVTSADPTPKLNDNVGFASAAAGFTGKRILWREFRP
jgi:Tfp pilus tip-associated adhesin PilY1